MARSSEIFDAIVPQWANAYPGHDLRTGEKIACRCPECDFLGTHLGTCSWSLMRSGNVWAFYAEKIKMASDPTP